MRLQASKQVWWWGATGLVVALALWRLGTVLTPFLIGAGIAYVLNPLVDRLERLGLHRSWAVGLITIAGTLVFALALLLIVPGLIRQTGQVIEAAPEMLDRFQSLLASRFPRLVPEGGALTTLIEKGGATAAEYGGGVLVTVLSSITNMLGVIALLVLAPVIAFYLLLDWHRMVVHLDNLLPREHADTIRAIAGDIDETLAGFLRGQGLVTLILGTFYAVGLFLVGLPFGLTIGILAAVLSIIPYAGVVIGGAVAIGVAVVHFWGEPVWIGAVVAIFAIGQLVEGNYLQPKIVGGHVGLHPVWLLMALAVSGSLFGFVGLVVAVPMAAAVGVVIRFFAGRYMESALYTGREVPPPPSQPTLVELVPRGTVAEARQRAAIAKAAAMAQQRVDLARREAERIAREGAGTSGHAEAVVTVALTPDRGPHAGAPGHMAVSADMETDQATVEGITEASDPETRRKLEAVAHTMIEEAMSVADGIIADDDRPVSAAVALVTDPESGAGSPRLVAASPAYVGQDDEGSDSRAEELYRLAYDAATVALDAAADRTGPVGAVAAVAVSPPVEGKASAEASPDNAPAADGAPAADALPADLEAQAVWQGLIGGKQPAADEDLPAGGETPPPTGALPPSGG